MADPAIFSCPICGLEMKHQRNIARHLKKQHPETVKPTLGVKKNPLSKCLIPECLEHFHHRTAMIKHLVDVHGESSEIETRTFNCVKDFQTWKRAEERELSVRFTARSGNSKLTGGAGYAYFVCQTDGLPKAHRGNGPVANPKSRRGLTCPARMCVHTIDKPRINVTYYKTHSHQNVPEDSGIPLSENVRDSIKVALLEGETAEDIVESFSHDDCDGKEVTVKRVIQLRRDLGLLEKVGPKGGDLDMFDLQDACHVNVGVVDPMRNETAGSSLPWKLFNAPETEMDVLVECARRLVEASQNQTAAPMQHDSPLAASDDVTMVMEFRAPTTTDPQNLSMVASDSVAGTTGSGQHLPAVLPRVIPSDLSVNAPDLLPSDSAHVVSPRLHSTRASVDHEFRTESSQSLPTAVSEYPPHVSRFAPNAAGNRQNEFIPEHSSESDCDLNESIPTVTQIPGNTVKKCAQLTRIQLKIDQLSALVESRNPGLNLKLTEAVLNSLLISAGVTDTTGVDEEELNEDTPLIADEENESFESTDELPDALPTGRPIIVMKLPNLMLSL